MPYAVVTLLGAFLLFLVQPLVARQVLPWFGGAQSVWSLCLVLYQALLLGGYFYAHIGRRLGVRRQAILHAVLLAASLALLPVTASARWKPVGPGFATLRLLGLLVTTVGGPYLLLAATAPLVQGWFARSRSGPPPYRLYALSNVGSLAALVAYPTLVEPLLPISRQSVVWSWAYAAFVVSCAGVALAVAHGAALPEETSAGTPEAALGPSGSDRRFWLALSACGTGLLLGLTNHMTTDVAAVPFLWVLPLAIYLATFVLAFARRYRRGTWGALLVLALVAMALSWDAGFALPLPVQVGLDLGALFAACMVCHGELAASAPSSSQVTSFYLTLAAGGAIGGALVGLVAPAVLPDLWEVPAFLLLSYALLLVAIERGRATASVAFGPWALALRRPLALLLLVAAAGFVVPSIRRNRGTVATRRGFYGVLRVQDAPQGMLAGERVLRVGRILHGGQFLDPARRREPTAYFVAGSGVARAITAHPRRAAGLPLRIGVIGLGVGTLAAWGEPGDSIRFYEINPDVEVFARRWFTFLADSEAAVSVVLGDGRLSLERELADPRQAPRFDVLVVDAFTGDAVPVHLLTREAAQLYARALAPDGVLAFNVTNRHLDLEPVIHALAGTVGRTAARVRYEPPVGSGGTPSRWMLLSPGRSSERSDVRGRSILWTDDFSSLLGVLR